MRKLTFSERAKADINSIWDYTAETWGNAQAERYNQLIQASCGSLIEHPQPGQPAGYIRSGYRKVHVGRHTIYFRLTDTAAEVIRILHQSMDVDEHLS